jgi:methionyl aminopeptidase
LAALAWVVVDPSPTRLRNNDPCWCGSARKLKRCHGDHRAVRRAPVTPGTVAPPRPVPAAIGRPPYLASGGIPAGGRDLQVMRGTDLERMRRAGAVAAEVLLVTGAAVSAGVTTEDLDEVAHDAYVRLGAYPSTLGYNGFPKSICASVNEVVCHGIPDDGRTLAPGDIVNIDVTAYIDGVHGDTSATFAVGELDPATDALVAATCEATHRGIAAVRAGGDLVEVGRAIEAHACARGLGVVRDYGGHGIGEVFHAEPQVLHVEDGESSLVLLEGMTFTIEPMLTAGTHLHRQWDDGWTVITRDLLPSAQFEHTVVVTADGAEVLTVTGDGGTAVTWPNA